jgi:hypothetical protein
LQTAGHCKHQAKKCHHFCSGDGFPVVFSAMWGDTVVARLPTYIADSGPVDFQPNMTPFEYFKRFTTADDEDIFDELVDETNRYTATALNATRRVTPHGRENNWKPVTRAEIIF